MNVECAACIGSEFRYKSKYKKVAVLPIWKVMHNVSSVDSSSERNIK